MIERITIIGTGLIGSSIGLALRASGFEGDINGIDANRDEYLAALNRNAISETRVKVRPNTLGETSGDPETQTSAFSPADVIILAVPVLAIKDYRCCESWPPSSNPTNSSKPTSAPPNSRSPTSPASSSTPLPRAFRPAIPWPVGIRRHFNLAEAFLFVRATWLFTPIYPDTTPLEQQWRDWVTRLGAITMDLDPARHDELCAWVSHLPQMLSTALAALLEDTFGDAPEIAAVGGRALRETTRLGASPYSMWRDVAMTNTTPIAETLHALEQRLAHIRENLRTPELRDEFIRANKFREHHS